MIARTGTAAGLCARLARISSLLPKLPFCGVEQFLRRLRQCVLQLLNFFGRQLRLREQSQILLQLIECLATYENTGDPRQGSDVREAKIEHAFTCEFFGKCPKRLSTPRIIEPCDNR